jgi:hypothetical protein
MQRSASLAATDTSYHQSRSVHIPPARHSLQLLRSRSAGRFNKRTTLDSSDKNPRDGSRRFASISRGTGHPPSGHPLFAPSAGGNYPALLDDGRRLRHPEPGYKGSRGGEMATKPREEPRRFATYLPPIHSSRGKNWRAVRDLNPRPSDP